MRLAVLFVRAGAANVELQVTGESDEMAYREGAAGLGAETSWTGTHRARGSASAASSTDSGVKPWRR